MGEGQNTMGTTYGDEEPQGSSKLSEKTPDGVASSEPFETSAEDEDSRP